MKKLIGGILASVALCTSLVAAGCGEPAHEHVYVEETVAATCTQEGYNQFVCECGDSYKGETVLPKTAHTGKVTCSTCQINYFDEIKTLVMENGTISSNGQYYYIGKTTSGTSSVQGTYVSYDPSNMNIFIGLNYEMPSLGAEYDFMIMISHPSEDAGLQTGKYTWMIRVKNDMAMGTLNGATFSSLTSSLSIEYNDGFKSITLESIRGLSASFAKSAIEDAFVPLLKLGDNGVTPANFGFVNF